MIPQFKKNNSRRIFFFALMLAISLSGKAQTIPNLYPAYWLGKQRKNFSAHRIVADTSLKPIRKCVELDTSLQRHSRKIMFVNHDSLIKKRVLKT